MLRIVAIKVYGQSRSIETYALLDECSDVSLCDRSLVDELGIEGRDKSFQLTTMSGKGLLKSGKEVALSISSVDGSESIDMDKVWTVDKIPVSPHSIPTSRDLKRWPHLQGIDFPLVGENNVRILIGSDTPEAFWHNEEKRGQRGEPYAMRSPLGWSIIGPTATPRRDQGSVNFTRGSEALLHKQMDGLWDDEDDRDEWEDPEGEDDDFDERMEPEEEPVTSPTKESKKQKKKEAKSPQVEVKKEPKVEIKEEAQTNGDTPNSEKKK